MWGWKCSVSWLYWCHSLIVMVDCISGRWYHWRKLGKRYIGSYYSPKCTWIYNYLQKNLIKKKKTTSQELSASSDSKTFPHSIWLLFSSSVVSDSLGPHGLQHTRLLCPPPTPGVCSSSCPLSLWCHPTISSSATPFSFCLQSFPASGAEEGNTEYWDGGNKHNNNNNQEGQRRNSKFRCKNSTCMS